MPLITSRLRLAIAGVLLAAVALAGPAVASTTSLDASPASVSGSSPVAVTAGVPASGATGGASQVITQAFDPTYLRLGGAAQVTAPEGWTTTFSSDGVTFGAAPLTAGDWAGIRAVRTSGSATGIAATGGTQSASVTAPPSGSFSGGGGGDGWDVFFDNGNRVYNIWHHNGSPFGGYNPRVDCHTRTGGSCGNGWPFSLSGLNTGMQSPGWVDAATGHLWFPTNDNGTQTGFACVDVSNLGSGAGQGPAWCGGTASTAFRVLGAGGPSSYGADSLCNTGYRFSCVTGLAVAGRRIYSLETRTGKVLCLDMAASSGSGAACAGQPYALSGVSAVPWQVELPQGSGLWLPALLNVNGRIIGTGRGSYSNTGSPVSLFCLAGDTGAPCPGWSAPKVVGNASSNADTPWLTYAEPSATGAINGVCVRAVTRTSGGIPICYSLDGSTITGNTAIAGTFRQPTGGENGLGTTTTTGSRVYWGNGTYNDNESRLYCSSAATNADCAGWPVITETANGAANRDNYALVLDPLNDNCLWVNSDSSGIYQYNSTGARGCSGIPPSSATFTASNLVTTQRVSCTGRPAWGTLAVTSPSIGTYATATLTVLDADGNTVTSGGTTWRNVPIGSDGTISLSGLAQADTGSTPQFVVNLTGRTDSSAIATTITAPAYPPQLCTTLTPQEIACPIATAPAGSLQDWASSVTASGTQGATQLPSAQAQITWASTATPACAPAPPSPAPPPSDAASEPPPPQISSPRVPPAGTAILTSVSVRAAGTVVQRGTRAAGQAACTSRPVTVSAPGTVRMACVLNARTLARLQRAPVRVRLVTTLRAHSGGMSTSTHVITLRRRTVPVTG